MSEWTEEVLKGQFAFVCNSDGLRQFVKEEDRNKFLVSQDSLITFVQAYTMRKNFPFKKDVSKVVTRLFEAGIVEKIDYATKGKLIEFPEFQGLSMDDLISPLLLLISGYALSFIFLSLEFFYAKVLINFKFCDKS
ncbi:uncharacterized protein LOC111642295 [Centruroides sculpturatus]|nr:uncharacterized protein LOC111642295 [Centruroides sculpturatus]